MSVRRWASAMVTVLAMGVAAGVVAGAGAGVAAGARPASAAGARPASAAGARPASAARPARSARAATLTMRAWRRGPAVMPTGGLGGPAGGAPAAPGRPSTIPGPAAPGTPSAPATTTAPSSTTSTGPATTSTGPAPPVLYRRAGAELTEYAIHLTRSTLDAGVIELVGTNYGMDEHDLTVSRGGRIIARTGLIAPRDDRTLSFTATPGTYKVYCSILDGAHDDVGMNAILTVR